MNSDDLLFLRFWMACQQKDRSRHSQISLSQLWATERLWNQFILAVINRNHGWDRFSLTDMFLVSINKKIL